MGIRNTVALCIHLLFVELSSIVKDLFYRFFIQNSVFLLPLKIKSFTIFDIFYVPQNFYFFCLIFETETCIFQFLDTNCYYTYKFKRITLNV